MIRILVIAWAFSLTPLELFADDDLNTAAYGVLQTYCLDCHGDDFKYPGLDLRSRETLLQPRDEAEDPFIVPGAPDQSRIWNAVDTEYMPPEDQPQPTHEERVLLRRWIEEGAEFPRAERPQREFVGERTLLEIILEDLEAQPAADRMFVRYFSLAHLWNDSDVSDEQLRIVRAAVSKLINSLSSQPRIGVPEPVDEDGVVLRIDLRDYGWENRRQWYVLLAEYPYGLYVAGEEAERVYELTHCDLPYLRADWFVYHASRPPLYHDLVTLPDFVGIPDQQHVLERLLGVDVRQNFELNRLWRAGFSGEKSGVSDHNRIVERHDARYGYYWPSYDSAEDSDRSNFFRFPLGPQFPGSRNLGAFEHDGGEMIFSLPNGLQAYMLGTNDGNRIDVGPQTIVRDPQQFSGSYDIVNGISCMGCHKHGMISFHDTIRQQFVGRTGAIADKVLELYPEQAVMDDHLNRDRQQFIRSLVAAIGPFLRNGDDDTREITEHPEPITAAAKQYDGRLHVDDVARELGLPVNEDTAAEFGIQATSGELATAIRFSQTLQRLELTPLTVDEPLTRKQWESVFQRTARELRIGVPLSIE